MAHWVDTYPHTVYASVLLKNNKIINWKIGERKWTHPLDMSRKIKVPFNMDDYKDETVEHTAFEVNNSKEHNEAFSKLAREWFRQWELHEEFYGQSPY